MLHEQIYIQIGVLLLLDITYLNKVGKTRILRNNKKMSKGSAGYLNFYKSIISTFIRSKGKEDVLNLDVHK